MDVPLSPLGKLEASAAAKFLEGYGMRRVVSSPLSRAVYGAERIREGRGGMEGGTRTLPGFSELKRGAWRGQTKESIGTEIYEAFNRAEPGTTPEGGESLNDIRERVLEARDEVLGMLEEVRRGEHRREERRRRGENLWDVSGDMEVKCPLSASPLSASPLSATFPSNLMLTPRSPNPPIPQSPNPQIPKSPRASPVA